MSSTNHASHDYDDGFADPSAGLRHPPAGEQTGPDPASRERADPQSLVGEATVAGSGLAEAVRNVKHGVTIGTRLGGAHGAVIGGLAGAATTVAHSKHRHMILVAVLCLVLPNVLLIAILGASLAGLGGVMPDHMSATAMSRNRDAGAISGEQAADYAEAASRSDVHWAVLAALEVETATGGDLAAAADSGVPTPNPNPDAVLNVQIASWNALKSNSVSRVIDGIKAIAAAGADVIGLQEITPDSKRNVLRKRLGPEWGMSRVDNAVIIVWRRDKVDLVAQHSEKVFDLVHVESSGIGGGRFGPKSLQWAEFKTRDTSAHFAVINNHLLPTIETRGKPNPRHPRRVAAAERQMDAALAAADKLQAAGLATFDTGDHNIAAAADARVQNPRFPHVKYAKHGLYSNWRNLGYPRNGTHGSRHIDYVFSSNALAAPIKQTILPRYGSDHHALLVKQSNDPETRTQARGAGTSTSVGGTPSLPAATSGTGPFHLDVAKYNALAKQWNLEVISEQTAEKRDDAGTAIGRLFSRLLADTDPALTARSLTAGADMVDTVDGSVLELGSSQDAVVAQQRTRTAFVTAFQRLPIDGADTRAVPWFQIALSFALGNPPSVCTTSATSVVTPTGSEAPTTTPAATASTAPTTSPVPTGTPTESASPVLPARSPSPTAGNDTDRTEDELADDKGNVPGGRLPTTLTATTTAGTTITLDSTQIQRAAKIIGYGERLQLERKYIQVALMTALQESKLRVYANSRVPESLTYPHEAVGSDHDSLNLFQQRPGAWGTVKQLMQVGFSIAMFYGGPQKPKPDGPPGLLDIPGHQSMALGSLAQKVQVSAFGSAYDQWAPVAATILDKVAGIDTGSAPSTSACTGGTLDSAFLGACPPTNMEAESQGVTPDALLVTRCVTAAFPQIQTIGTYPGHQPTAAQAVDIAILGWDTPQGQDLGTQVSRWLQTHQKELGVHYVIWWGEIWNHERDSEGWRTYFDAESSDPDRSHHSHVHVSVYGTNGTGPTAASVPALEVAAGAWANPSGGKASITCDMACYSGHTGIDYGLQTGDPVFTAFTGTVITSESLPASGGSCTPLPICGGSAHRSYGNFIVVQSAEDPSLTAYYAHLSKRLVPVGTRVNAGRQIGAAGFEGNVRPAGPGGAHLHFEIRDDGTTTNPIPLLDQHGAGR